MFLLTMVVRSFGFSSGLRGCQLTDGMHTAWRDICDVAKVNFEMMMEILDGYYYDNYYDYDHDT